MATIIHDDFRDAMLGYPDATVSTIDFNADNIDVSLLDATDSGTIDATYIDYDEVDAPDVVATTDLASITIGAGGKGGLGTGILDAADTTFSSVSGDAADYLVLWKNSGTPASSPLAVTWDSAITGLPVTPNSGDIIVAWNASGILSV